ncbi:MAG: twin-arginine translocation signal domain-containing protein, partial [Pararhodobacter sp.]|nr:twin-arginine translocation signal domain-containing protein [Pararhodobacter sp.]
MNDQLRYYLARAAQGKMDRRAFMGRAAALGITGVAASSLLSTAVHAQGPRKGGHLKIGMLGGESTNNLDPALGMTQVPALILG